MGRIVRGAFDFQYGANTLAEIDEFSVNYDVATDDQTSLQGRTYEIEGAHKVSVEVSFLHSDVPSLAVALPQFFVANGEQLSTGETVTDPEGAIDIVPSNCETDSDVASLIVRSCGDNAEVSRIPQCTTRFGGFVFDGNVRKVKVVFNGVGTTTTQFFREDAITNVS